MPKPPLIGVTLDAEPAGGWSKLPWYALRQNYFASVIAAGGLPVALPHHPELAEAYLDRLDGLLVTGGAFDVDPALWGGGPPHPKVTLKPGRTDFELAAVRAALAHEQPNPRTEPGHEVEVSANTLLASIVGAQRLAVNSAHHQAVATPGNGAVVNARAPDGVVEGIEHPGYRFALGVQWHPEYAVDPRDPAIFDAFIRAAQR